MLDYRLYDPDGDGKTKLDHVQEMLCNVVQQKALPFYAVLMDTWYAPKDLMLFIESLTQIYYCPLARSIARWTIRAARNPTAAMALN